MKKIKIASLVLFAMMVFACEKSMAQNNDNTNSNDPNAGTQQATDPNTANESTNVTIDSTATSTPPASSEHASGTPAKSESATKIHIYSGNHDGNNIINPDPKF